MKNIKIDEHKAGTPSVGAVSLSFTTHQQNTDYQTVKTDGAFRWFPMRVTYHRELKIKSLLDNLNIENFLPMRYELVETKGEGKKRQLLPAIHNLIFVHSSQETLTYLKMTQEAFSPMRYMTKKSLEQPDAHEIITIPDSQMNNFMRVASIQDDRVIFLDYSQLHNPIGKHVKIIDGYFAGVEGTIKRIGKNKRVVVQIDGISAVAIAFVPSSCLSLQD